MIMMIMRQIRGGGEEYIYVYSGLHLIFDLFVKRSSQILSSYDGVFLFHHEYVYMIYLRRAGGFKFFFSKYSPMMHTYIQSDYYYAPRLFPM